MPAESDLCIVEIDDWTGIYIDGRLDWEGHSLSTQDFIERFAPHVRLQSLDGTPVDEHAADVGGLPDTLDEIEKINA